MTNWPKSFYQSIAARSEEQIMTHSSAFHCSHCVPVTWQDENGVCGPGHSPECPYWQRLCALYPERSAGLKTQTPETMAAFQGGEQISLAVANQARELTEQYWRETVRELERNQAYLATMAWTGWLLAAFLLVVLISCVEGPTIMQEWSRMWGA